MDDIQIRVNYRTWQIIMTVWVLLLITIVVAPMVKDDYELPSVIMNLFMLLTGSISLVFTAFEKGVTFGGDTSKKVKPTGEENLK